MFRQMSRFAWAFWICAIGRFVALVPFVIDDDEAWWSSASLGLSSPSQFYFTAPDNKTPGTVWFYWLLGSDPRIARAVYILLTIGAGWWVGRLAQHFSKGSSDLKWRVGTLFLLASALASPKLLALTDDGLLVILTVLAFSIALLCENVFACFAAGAVFGVALLVKQTAVFAAFPILFSRWPKRWKGMDLLWMSLGTLAVLVPVVWALQLSEMLYWVWIYPREVLVTVRHHLFSTKELLANAAVWVLAVLPLVLAVSRFRGGLFDFRVQWLIAALGIVAMGQGLFLHYFLMLSPPLALIAGEVFAKRKQRTWESLWLYGGYALSCGLLLVPASSVVWGTDLAYFRNLNSVIAPYLAQDQKVMVWGGSALPLSYARARHSTRFVLPRFGVAPYATERTRGIFHQELMQDPPAVVMDLHERGDNQFAHPIESEPVVAALLRDYHLYVAPSIPWAKFYFKERPRRNPSGLVAIETPEAKARVYSPYPAQNPAWKAFEKLLAPPASLALLENYRKLDQSLRMEHALELLSLQSGDKKTRVYARQLALRLRAQLDSGHWVERSPAQVESETARTIEHLMRNHLPISLSSSEWWFTVSLAQMQPRALEGVP